MKRFYLPISAFVFPEVAVAEAVFPSDCDVMGAFIGRSNYPTTTTGTIPVNPTGKALILYSTPVTWAYRDGPSMDYPIVIEIPETWVDNTVLTELRLGSLPDGISAWSYSGTIFFERDVPVRYVFRTEAEKRERIDSLLSYTELKDLKYLERTCCSFEQTGLSVVELPDVVGDDIRKALSSLEIDSSRCKEDLLKETRCGACLGYAISQLSREQTMPISLEDVLKALPSGALVKARKVAEEVTGKLRQLEEILSDSMGVEYAVLPISVRSAFKFNGRACLQLWSHIDPRIQKCVDFIADYPRKDWNWFGDEERFVFMRELWNQVLQPTLNANSLEVVDALRAEMLLICRHFRNPNSYEFSFNSVRSPLLQAFCIALDCPRGSEKLKEYLKEARRPDYCLSVFGALRGYAYFSRELFPNYCRYDPPVVQSLRKKEPKPIDEMLSNMAGKAEPQKLESKPIEKTSDMPLIVPEWALRFLDMLKSIFAACKTKPKKSKDLRELFCQAAQECGSEDRLLATLSKKPGWSTRTSVYRELSQKMTVGETMEMSARELTLFEHAKNVPMCSSQEERSSKENGITEVSEQETPPTIPETKSRKLTSLIKYEEWLDECASLMQEGSKERWCFCEDVKYYMDKRELHPEPLFASGVKDKSNSAVLSRLRTFLESQRHTRNPKQIWKLAVYEKIPISEIIEKLRGMYGC